jgi:Ran GTPase-activating protein (RanGAP) involved in mRNA processing and transport
MQLISDYLAKNPNMRSLILDGNEISDYGMQRLAHSLKKNKKLAHISIKNCP